MNHSQTQMSRQNLQVFAYLSVPDRDLIDGEMCKMWLQGLPMSVREAQRRSLLSGEHPLFSRIVGVANGRLQSSGTTIGLESVSVVVGDEKTVLASAAGLVVESDAQIIYYSPHQGDIDLVAFRILQQRRLPLLVDVVEIRGRCFDLARGTSLGGRVATVPLPMAVAAVGGFACGQYLPSEEIAWPALEKDVARIEAHLVAALDMTSSLYCRLSGVEREQYRSVGCDTSKA